MYKYLIPLLLTLSGCVTSSVVVGTVRPAISPGQVKIYVQAPAKFENIALLETSSENSWAGSAQGQMNAVIANMKKEAARLGANGILLSATGNKQTNGLMMIPSGATSVAVPISSQSKTGNGMAIHVIEE